VSVRAIDPNWPSAGEWLAGEHAAKTIGTLTMLGAPVGLGSLSGGRCDLAPQAIRAALARYSTYDVEFGRDLRALAVHDCGDLKIADLRPEEALTPIRDAVSKAVKHSAAVVILGGDNSITYPAA
jgi:formiminoglutamase